MTETGFNLPDGRNLGYARYGAEDGWPVLYFHGTPSSRLEVQLLEAFHINVEQDLLEAGLTLIAVDRPGIGLSSFHSNVTLLSFARDVYSLLNALAVTRCSVLCWSGGGPYALAMACQYPSLVRNVFMLCGFSQRLTSQVVRKMGSNKWFFRAAKFTPWALELCMNLLRRKTTLHPPPQWLTGLPGVDYELMKDQGRFQKLAALTFKEACQNGARGAVQEARLYFKDFGFALSEIRQPVHFWWGTEDKNVIRLHAESVETYIKNSVLHYREGEGHLSLYIHCFKEVIKAVSSAIGG
jgi:pimeloyl-ACP methyl ester carboxylesterase